MKSRSCILIKTPYLQSPKYLSTSLFTCVLHIHISKVCDMKEWKNLMRPNPCKGNWKASLHGHPFSALWTKCEHIDVSNRGDGCMSWNGTLQKGHDKPRCILCFRSHLWHNQCLDLELLCLQNECIVRIL